METTEPSLRVISVGLKEPVSTASVGKGLAPPMGMMPPVNDKPSEPNVKYDEPNIWLEPSEKSTWRLKPE